MYGGGGRQKGHSYQSDQRGEALGRPGLSLHAATGTSRAQTAGAQTPRAQTAQLGDRGCRRAHSGKQHKLQSHSPRVRCRVRVGCRQNTLQKETGRRDGVGWKQSLLGPSSAAWSHSTAGTREEQEEQEEEGVKLRQLTALTTWSALGLFDWSRAKIVYSERKAGSAIIPASS